MLWIYVPESLTDSGHSLMWLVLSYITLSIITSHHCIFTQTGLPQNISTDQIHQNSSYDWSFISLTLRVTKFPQNKVYVHSLQEQEWHAPWQVPAALLAWTDMLSNPILGSAELPITSVHERSSLSFVITTHTQKKKISISVPVLPSNIALYICSFP